MSFAASASSALRGIAGANVTPERGQNRCAVQGSPASLIVFSMPSASRAPNTCVRSYASSVSTSPIVARAAAIESGFPNSVPPVATASFSSERPAGRSRMSATASVIPYAPSGTPPAMDLPIVTISGWSDHIRVSPPGPTTWVWVSS